MFRRFKRSAPIWEQSIETKERDENPDTTVSFSSAGLSWNCSWLSYVEARLGYSVYLPGGCKSLFWATDQTNYYNNMRLHVYTNSGGAPITYDFLYPDGSKDVYGFTPTNIYGGSISKSYLSQKIDPQGHVTSFLYEPYDPDILNIRLKYVVDHDGRTNTISYATSG